LTEKGGIVVDFDQAPKFIGQHSPRKANMSALKIVGTDKKITNALETKVSIPARTWLLQNPDCFVLLIDDLESSRIHMAQEVFTNYRSALDKALPTQELRDRVSVHFFINMLEAYYFAHPEAVNDVLRTNLVEPTTDVEDIEHPKNALDKEFKFNDSNNKFKEIEHGTKIVNRLDLERILANPQTCRALRALVGWCRHRLGAPFDARWRLLDGEFHPLTRDQIPWPIPSLPAPDGT
jgi:hypothetical protein